MLTQIHLLLTYTCNFECDHCFLYCGPNAQGTFTINQIDNVLEEARKMGSIEWIYFEGGEPFLFFPVLAEGIKRAGAKGFKVGVVTNAYGAISEEDAELWLRPLAQSGISFLSISNDTFHYGDETENAAAIASSVAKRLHIETSSICIEPPRIAKQSSSTGDKGNPVIGGSAMFRGRASEKLIEGLPLRPWAELSECPHEELVSPHRVHVDAYGNVQVCQGISIGNMWETPLSRLISEYRADAHPICGPLVQGGPAKLANAMGLKTDDGYVDECHFCYTARKAMIDLYPDYLAPRQVYGLD